MRASGQRSTSGRIYERFSEQLAIVGASFWRVAMETLISVALAFGFGRVSAAERT